MWIVFSCSYELPVVYLLHKHGILAIWFVRNKEQVLDLIPCLELQDSFLSSCLLPSTNEMEKMNNVTAYVVRTQLAT